MKYWVYSSLVLLPGAIPMRGRSWRSWRLVGGRGEFLHIPGPAIRISRKEYRGIR